MTRLKQARIALTGVAFANIALVIAGWPHPSKLTTLGTLIVCAGALLLSYRESPEHFHRPVSRRMALGLLLVPVALIGVGLGLDSLGTGAASGRAVTAQAGASPAPAVASSTPTVTTPNAPAARLALQGRTITIDPGHNGGNFTDARAISRLVPDGAGAKECDTTGTAAPDGYRETDFNWSVGRRLQTLAKAAGAHVVMTRSSNTGVGPCVNERAAIGNRAHSDAAISIHADGGPPGGSGFAILVPAPIPGGADSSIIGPSHRMAIDLRHTLIDAGLHSSTYDGVAGIAPRTDLGGLNLSRVPKVFVEVANMQNRPDEEPMERASYREHVAQALLAGLERFLATGPAG